MAEESAHAPSPPAAPAVAKDSYALFERFPSLGAKLPRIQLARLPSRIESAGALGAKIGVTSLFVKRDDDLAEIVGGGKVRKLELFFADAKAQGRTDVVTFGGVGSNQAVTTALLGRALGLNVHLYLAPQPRSSLVTTNLGADAAAQAEIRLFDSVSLAESIAARSTNAEPARSFYAIPPGGTTPLGTLAFVNAGLELAMAIRKGEIPMPTRIYVALGLGGTAAGIAMGCAIAGLDTEVVAVRASNPSTVSPTTIESIVSNTGRFARTLDATFPAMTARAIKLRIDGRFVGAGYGAPTREGDAAIVLAKRAAGWELDPVYTGKAFAALCADAKSTPGGPWLFWNTQNSRHLQQAPVPAEFRSFLGEPG